MNLIFYIAIGALLGILPVVIISKVKKGVELNYWERDKNFSKASLYLLVFAWVIIIESLAFAFELHSVHSEKIDELEKRIEVLEVRQQVDTINVLDAIKNNYNHSTCSYNPDNKN